MSTRQQTAEAARIRVALHSLKGQDFATGFSAGMQAALSHPEWARAIVAALGAWPPDKKDQAGMNALIRYIPVEAVDA